MTKPLDNDTEAQHRRTFFEPPPDLATLARLQGTAPVDFDELMATPEHWPDDESVDDFISALRNRT